jgi:saccharopine dehydrogenase-like NADP-dependent oxidoreductase
MPRLLVLGATGFFGQAALHRLRADGFQPLAASRRPGGDLQLDVEDPTSLRAVLRPGDVLLDTVGPFQERTTALLEAALAIGCDLIDIADSRAYVAQVIALEDRIAAAGIRVVTASSSVSAISAAFVTLSGITAPVRVTGCLAPAARYASTPGSGASLLRSVGQPVFVIKNGKLTQRVGWRDTHAFHMPPPIGRTRGYLFETADAVTLPRLWPSLRTVDFYVDSRVPGLNLYFRLAARSRPVWLLAQAMLGAGLKFARAVGSPTGCLAFEVEAPDGRVVTRALIAAENGYFTPIAPAVLAAEAIVAGRFEPTGLVSHHQHVEPDRLMRYLDALGIRLETV